MISGGGGAHCVCHYPCIGLEGMRNPNLCLSQGSYLVFPTVLQSGYFTAVLAARYVLSAMRNRCVC